MSDSFYNFFHVEISLPVGWLKKIFLQHELYLFIIHEKFATMRTDERKRSSYKPEGAFLRAVDDGFILRVT
jgi:hypothetical protein